MNGVFFEYSDKTKSFINFNENQNELINHNEINQIICEFPHLYFITKNNKLYRIVLEDGKVVFQKENVISATSIYGQCNYLTQNVVILKNNNLINLPQQVLDKNNDKFVKFAVIGSSYANFLLTEKGKVYIYGQNSYGVFGCKNLEIDEHVTKFTKHKELEKKMTSKIVDIKCGYNFCVIKCENGNCYGSGYNYYTDMGIIDENIVKEFTLLKEIEGKVKQYGCGNFSCAFLTFDGEIYICGKQGDGQFGKKFTLKSGDLGIPLTKLELNGINLVKRKMKLLKLEFNFLLTEKGKVYIYGKNVYGIFGCKTLKNDEEMKDFTKHTELEKKMKSKIVDIKCGYNFCVIKCENGNCYGSGYIFV
ncbi:hypothetical protein ABK040_003601 [Willaertia magna]